MASSRWHTDLVRVKTSVLSFYFPCFAIPGWSFFLGFLVVSNDSRKFVGVSHTFQWIIGIINTLFFYCTFVSFYCSLILEWPNPKDVRNRVGFCRSLVLFYFWLQFVNFYLVIPGDNLDRITCLIGMLSLVIQSFCVEEAHRIPGLHDEDLLIPSFGYFKFVAAASICTASNLFGFGSTYFWIVFSISVSLTLLHRNYFNASDFKDDESVTSPNCLRQCFHCLC